MSGLILSHNEQGIARERGVISCLIPSFFYKDFFFLFSSLPFSEHRERGAQEVTVVHTLHTEPGFLAFKGDAIVARNVRVICL